MMIKMHRLNLELILLVQILTLHNPFPPEEDKEDADFSTTACGK